VLISKIHPLEAHGSLGRVTVRSPGAWDTRWRPMQLRLSNPSYTDRLATFLRSLGQTVLVPAPNRLVIDLPRTSSGAAELRIYLRVWKVLYPDGEVQLEKGEGPAA
jgi:N-formylglutamate amidohydrolase